ncbi:hypothetical protein F4703DRAFT_1868460, partial [Phycomyces blakesleeanus]
MLLLLFNTLAHTRSYSRTIYIYEPLSYFGYTILYILLLLFNTRTHTKSYSRNIYIYELLSYFGYTIIYIYFHFIQYTVTHQKLLPNYIYI